MKKLYSLVFFVLLFGFSLVISGCKDEEVAPMILPQFCQYFPETMIFAIDKRILWIQTNIDGISSDAADLMFKQDCEQSNTALIKKSFGLIKNVKGGLIAAGKQVLIIGFKHFWVVWSVRDGVDYQGIPVNYRVMDDQTFHDWLTRSLGVFPTPDQIQVINLQEIQNTPKGQPEQLQTLAQIQQQKIQQSQPNTDVQNIGSQIPVNK